MVDIIRKNIVDLNQIFQDPRVKRAEVFSSAFSDKFHEGSDIDILVTFNKTVELLDYADYYFDLKEKLEDLFRRRVDLVSSRSLKNPILKESSNCSKVSFYAS
ncbi:MAG: nucleotidyltransferase domain-containing protein [Flavobacteriales bacterium]|nr:nucleotidyltransferase domain-containing protein [Flavobacteriales bacterium]